MSEPKPNATEKLLIDENLNVRLAQPHVQLTGREALDVAEQLVRVGFRAVMREETRRAGLRTRI